MGSIGMPELMVILLIVVLVFGAGKLPRSGKTWGKRSVTSKVRPSGKRSM